MSTSAQVSANATLGWRFGVGVALLAGGYLALGLIPLVRSTDLAVGLKTVLTAFITATPALSKVAAIAVMGKPGFQFLQAHLFKALHRLRPAQQVSRHRYRIGLILFLIPIVGGWLVLRDPGFSATGASSGASPATPSSLRHSLFLVAIFGTSSGRYSATTRRRPFQPTPGDSRGLGPKMGAVT